MSSAGNFFIGVSRVCNSRNSSKRLAALASLALVCSLTSNMTLANTSKNNPCNTSADNPFCVCTITINSDNEAKAFENQLKGSGFNTLELTTRYTQSPNPSDDTSWLEQACQDTKLFCDVVLISGHYSGHNFFGENKQFALNTNELERLSCFNLCPNILSSPHSVFLFGCATTSENKEDPAAFKNYKQRLESVYNISAYDAENMAQARYGQAGEGFGAQIRRIFQGVPTLHGFYSTAPLGSVVEKNVNNYLNRAKAQSMNQAHDKIEKAISMVHRLTEEDVWRAAIGGSASSCSGVPPGDPVKKEICELYLDTPIEKKLKKIREMLEGPNWKTYLPVVTKFVKDHYYSIKAYKTLVGPENFSTLAGSARAKANLQNLYIGLQDSPFTEIETLSVLHSLDWVSKEIYLSAASEKLNTILSPLSAKKKCDLKTILTADNLLTSEIERLLHPQNRGACD